MREVSVFLALGYLISFEPCNDTSIARKPLNAQPIGRLKAISSLDHDRRRFQINP